jgi:hypothetical protein
MLTADTSTAWKMLLVAKRILMLRVSFISIRKVHNRFWQQKTPVALLKLICHSTEEYPLDIFPCSAANRSNPFPAKSPQALRR